MRKHIVERVLWGATVCMLVAGLIAWRDVVPEPLAQPPVIWAIPHAPEWLAARALDSAASVVTEADPFRLDRQPASVAFGAEQQAKPAPTPPKPRKPTLALAGIVGGPPWVALIDGVPGRAGSVLVRAGDTLGELRIRTVNRTTITITGLDTTWKLTLKRPWQ